MIQIFYKSVMNLSQNFKLKANALTTWVKNLRKNEQRGEQLPQMQSVVWLKWSIIVMCILGSVSLMTGCASPTKSLEVLPPVNAATKCEELTPLEGKTGKALIEKLVEVAMLYNDCKARHNTLVDWVDNGN